MKGDGVQPSRTPADLKPREAAYFVRVAQRDLSAAAALTAGWTRRQLIDVCLTLALGTPADQPMRPVRPVAPVEERPARPHALAYIGPRYDVAEAAWTDQELRDAHAAFGRGERDLWAIQGERLYQRISKRRSRPALRDLAVGDDRHGTRNGYEIGCRCRPCTDAKAAHKRAGRARGWAS